MVKHGLSLECLSMSLLELQMKKFAMCKVLERVGNSALLSKNNSDPPLFGAIMRGPPSARKTHAGKYGELTPLRQRGGSGMASPLPTAQNHLKVLRAVTYRGNNYE